MSNRLYYCEFPIYTRERKAHVSGAAATIGNGVKMRNYQMSMGLFWLGLCRARAELDAHNISCIYSSAVSFLSPSTSLFGLFYTDSELSVCIPRINVTYLVTIKHSSFSSFWIKFLPHPARVAPRLLARFRIRIY
jgi:hypothetical protein